MRKRQTGQLALPLAAQQVEVTDELLRAAHRRSRLRIGFEEAMQLEHFRIGLRHVAMIMAVKGRQS